MLRFLKLSLVVLLCSLSGCASIVSKSKWPFSVTSEPTGAKVVITNKKGTTVYSGKTPAAMLLKSGSGFFAPESYKVTLMLNGFETKTIEVKCKLNAWYFGNVVFGGLLGLIIIDPLTGAMYKLGSDGLSEELTKLKGTAGTQTLKIIELSEVPEHLKKNLVKL